LLCIFPLRETFCVSTSASDHTRSLFNDGGGFYVARHITRKKPVKKILFSKFGSIRFLFAKLGHQETAANPLPKNPVSSDASQLPPRSAISASPHFPCRILIDLPFRQQKKAPIPSRSRRSWWCCLFRATQPAGVCHWAVLFLDE